MNLEAGVSCVGNCGVYALKILFKYLIMSAAIAIGIIFAATELVSCIFKIPKLFISSVLDDLFHPKGIRVKWSDFCNETLSNNNQFGILELIYSIMDALTEPKKYLEKSTDWIKWSLHIDDTLEDIEQSYKVFSGKENEFDLKPCDSWYGDLPYQDLTRSTQSFSAISGTLKDDSIISRSPSPSPSPSQCRAPEV